MTTEETAKATDEGGIEVTAKIGTDEVAALDQQAEWATKNWGWVLFTGIVAIIFGVIVLGINNAVEDIALLGWLLGFYLLYAGIVDIATSGSWGSRALGIVVGILAIIAGLIVMGRPLVWGGWIVPWIMGIAFIVWGVARAVHALANKEKHRIWSLILGVLMVIAGVVALVHPIGAALLIAILMGLNALFYGIFAVISSFTMRNARKDWEAQKAQLKQA